MVETRRGRNRIEVIGEKVATELALSYMQSKLVCPPGENALLLNTGQIQKEVKETEPETNPENDGEITSQKFFTSFSNNDWGYLKGMKQNFVISLDNGTQTRK